MESFFDRMEEEFKPLIDSMEKAPKAQPPIDFTEKLMGRLAERNWKPLFSLERVALYFKALHFKARQAFARPLARNEYMFGFFIVGLFYLMIGIFLLAGLRGLPPGITGISWMYMLPWTNIGIALLFIIFSASMASDYKTAMQSLRTIITCYFVLVLINGIVMKYLTVMPYSPVWVAMFTATGAFIGILLAVSAKRITELSQV